MSELTYDAKPWHLLFAVVLAIAGAFSASTSIALSAMLFFLALIASVWMLIVAIGQMRIEYNHSIVEIAQEIKAMEPDRYRALGIAIPEIHIYASKDGPIELLEDTEIRMDMFRQFINDSDEYQFAPQRLYGDGTIARRQWFMTAKWLIDKGHLIDSTMTGSHSYLWRSGRRILIMREYLNELPAPLLNLNDEESLRA